MITEFIFLGETILKKILSIILTVCLMTSIFSVGIFGITASAATTGTTGSCTWVLESTVLTIKGNGKMGYATAPWGTEVTKAIINEGVTNVGGYAFSGCVNLASVTIPDSVTSIGSQAFYGCTNLENLTLQNGVKSIGSNAFSGCSNFANLTIPESITSIGNNAFSGCGNLTLTIDEDNAYAINYAKTNGINYQTTQILPNIAFKGAALSLHHDLSINYKVDKALFETVGYTNPYVVFELDGKKTTVRSYYVDGDRYVFTFNNIAPNKMNDTISATLYATYNGVEYSSAVKEYSVAAYCYNILAEYSANEYAELRTLLVDLLNYGAQAQTYTKHNTDNLVNSNLTDTQLAWGTAQEPTLTTALNTTYKTVENPLITWKGAGLNLKDSVAMRFKFLAEDINGLSLKITSDVGEWDFNADKFVLQDGVYYIQFTGLNAGQMSEKVYLTMYKNGVAVSNTVCYSIESYAYNKQNSADTALANLVKAMMKYGNSANAYVTDDSTDDNNDFVIKDPEADDFTNSYPVKR